MSRKWDDSRLEKLPRFFLVSFIHVDGDLLDALFFADQIFTASCLVLANVNIFSGYFQGRENFIALFFLWPTVRLFALGEMVLFCDNETIREEEIYMNEVTR